MWRVVYSRGAHHSWRCEDWGRFGVGDALHGADTLSGCVDRRPSLTLTMTYLGPNDIETMFHKVVEEKKGLEQRPLVDGVVIGQL